MARRRFNKPRLYVSLLYRQNQDDFHWAITLAPKTEVPNARDSVRYDAANTITAAWDGVPPVPWRYRYDPVDPLLDLKLVARILVAKLPGSTSFADWAAQIDETCRAVPLVQGDPSWTCRTWAHEALAALRALGGAFATIPDVRDGNAAEGEMIAVAQIAKPKLLGGEIPLGDIRLVPTLDMRRR
ncbi:hypothetical protein B0H15DRAFT_949857 [Mycena belliarum]|uniref:Uncharacterized protein n=1 Tax=Mycena belliarum TaxID=1033014 RepID=A0AAD6XUD4_9AGAR|nr:hypothetical protein B0H15DRAFT_949857 [Mycena belliae]